MYWIFKEHTPSFIEIAEGGVNVEIYELYDDDIVPLVNGKFDSLLHSILVYL